MSLIYEPDYDSKEDVHPEYSTLVRISYEKLFGVLLEAELDRGVRGTTPPLRRPTCDT